MKSTYRYYKYQSIRRLALMTDRYKCNICLKMTAYMKNQFQTSKYTYENMN